MNVVVGCTVCSKYSAENAKCLSRILQADSGKDWLGKGLIPKPYQEPEGQNIRLRVAPLPETTTQNLWQGRHTSICLSIIGPYVCWYHEHTCGGTAQVAVRVAWRNRLTARAFPLSRHTSPCLQTHLSSPNLHDANQNFMLPGKARCC